MTSELPEALQQRLDDDFRWGLSDQEVQKRHGGQVIAVRDRRILGAGRTLPEAWEDAQAGPDCPPQETVAFVPVPHRVAEPAGEFAWCLQPPTQEEHAGLVAVIQGRTVWGSGPDRAAALEAARRSAGCPSDDDLCFVVVPIPLKEEGWPAAGAPTINAG